MDIIARVHELVDDEDKVKNDRRKRGKEMHKVKRKGRKVGSGCQKE